MPAPNPPPHIYLKLIQLLKNRLKKDDVLIEMCREYDFDIDDIDLIPVKFGDIDVSATTNKGVITLNWALLKKNNKNNDIQSYLLHEIQHFISQSEKPTQSADDGSYLDNKDEQIAFQRQLQYIDEHYGEEGADNYAEQVLDHHDETGKEREKKKDILMRKVD